MVKFSRKVALNAPFKDYLGKDNVVLGWKVDSENIYFVGQIQMSLN
jgi:hypothetical protein